jgi:hypothetical protein
MIEVGSLLSGETSWTPFLPVACLLLIALLLAVVSKSFGVPLICGHHVMSTTFWPIGSQFLQPITVSAQISSKPQRDNMMDYYCCCAAMTWTCLWCWWGMSPVCTVPVTTGMHVGMDRNKRASNSSGVRLRSTLTGELCAWTHNVKDVKAQTRGKLPSL